MDNLKSVELTLQQMAFNASSLSGTTVTTDDIVERFGRPENGKYSPIQLRQLHAELVPSRAEFLMGERAPDFRPHVVVCHFMKGGVGKTTLLANSGFAAAARLGYRILIIDADPQGTTSTLFGVDVEDDSLITLMHLNFMAGTRMDQAIRPLMSNAVLDLLPSDVNVGAWDLNASPRTKREFLIEKMFKDHAAALSKYDIIFVDTNPGPTLLNQNLMIAADSIMVPVSLDIMSVKSLRLMAASMAAVDGIEPKDRNLMLIANVEQANTTHSRTCLEGLQKNYGDQLLNAVIPAYSGFKRQGWGDTAQLLIEREPNSPASHKIVELALELTNRTIWAKEAVPA